MTEKEINALIAKTCGWVPRIIGWKIAESETSIPAAINFISAFEAQEYLDRARRNTEDYDRKMRVFPVWEACPDYCNDLNAMHEAENKLINHHDLVDAYIKEICVNPEEDYQMLFFASSSERAHALVNVIKKNWL